MRLGHAEGLKQIDGILADLGLRGEIGGNIDRGIGDDEGRRIASKLGNKKVIFLANHGVVVVGPNVAEAFDDLYYLERAAMLQVLAQSTGKPYQKISSKVVDLTVEQMIGEAETALLHFEALKRILHREEPDYVN